MCSFLFIIIFKKVEKCVHVHRFEQIASHRLTFVFFFFFVIAAHIINDPFIVHSVEIFISELIALKHAVA